jgi:hypothetical protein
LLGTCRVKVFLEFIWVPQTWPSWTAITRTQWPAAAWESAIVVIYVWIRVLFSSPLPTPPKRAFFFPPNLCCSQTGYHFYFFQFPDGARLANIPRQIQTDFARLVTLFQETLETGASRHKCGHTLPNHLLRWFWMKNPLFFPL